jgi:hypothetical protein
MKSDILNAPDCSVTPAFGYGEANRIDSELSDDDKRRTVCITIYVPTEVCEFVGGTVEISTAANAAGTVRIHSSPFVLTDAQNNRFSCEVLLEGLAFLGAFQPTA